MPTEAVSQFSLVCWPCTVLYWTSATSPHIPSCLCYDPLLSALIHPLNRATSAFTSASSPTFLYLYSPVSQQKCRDELYLWPLHGFSAPPTAHAGLPMLSYQQAPLGRSWWSQWGDPSVSLERRFHDPSLQLSGSQWPGSTPEELRPLAWCNWGDVTVVPSSNCAISSKVT